jgi:hypothetical protein
MAVRLGKEIKCGVKVGGEEVLFTLRRPDNEELSSFMKSRFIEKPGKVEDIGPAARVKFFDDLLQTVENFEDAAGKPIGPDRKELVPDNWKQQVIFSLFEAVQIDLKN